MAKPMMAASLLSVLSLCVAAPEAPARARTPNTREWQQPAIKTGTPFTDRLPWAPTVEAALARAKQEHRLVLATVVAVSDDHWVSGYDGAKLLWRGLEPPVFGEDVSMALDEGLRKEQVMMAAWFSDPECAALVAQHCVPVRVRCRPWDFDLDFPNDPLAPLGTKLDVVGAPALVIATPEGRCVHTLGRVGVFAPAMMAPMLRAVLAKAGVRKVEAPKPDPRREPIRKLVEQEQWSELRRVLAGSAEPEAMFWLGLAHAKLGELDRARASWDACATADANGAWGGRAAMCARKAGVQVLEWITWRALACDPLVPSTETDAGRDAIDEILERAADVLLAMQSEDGGWHNPALDVRSVGGAGTAYDYNVPRAALVVDALLAVRSRLPHRADELEAAALRGIHLVGEFADAPQPWIWHATYALHLQLELLRSNLDAEKPRAKQRARNLVVQLEALIQDGGWSYMPAPRTHSFNTALVLLLFAELRSLGEPVPAAAVSGAQKFLASLRNPNDERDYWYAASMRFEPRAATCRTALCELALLESGDRSAARRIGRAIEFFFEGEPQARSVTKIYESFLSPKSLQDAYHYYFGHYYAARALAHLPRTQAALLAKQQIAILKKQVELDGSFVDAQAQGKSYSTAMALLTLIEDLRYTKP